MLAGMMVELEGERREAEIAATVRDRQQRQLAMAASAARAAGAGRQDRPGSSAGLRGRIVALVGSVGSTRTPPGSARADCAGC
jgi:hypothetical protein